MKLTDIDAISKTRATESAVVPGLWLSRSAVALGTISGSRDPVCGFAFDFDLELSRRKAIFELIEHLAFHPKKPLLSADTKLWQRSDGRWRRDDDVFVDDLLLGASNSGQTLHGNGCAVHEKLRDAAAHAENEALERHYCCEMWYNRSIRPTPLPFDVSIKDEFHDCIKAYDIETPTPNNLVICIIDSDEFDFFCMGASLKPTKQAAIRHSLGEAATLFEDVLRRRWGQAATRTATTNILSLRNRQQSQLRKQHFLSLLNTERRSLRPVGTPTVHAFKILDGIVAARASTTGLLTPRRYHNRAIDMPVMPLF